MGDILTGNMINVDPVELDGPRAQLTEESLFFAEDGATLSASDVSRGTFVRVVTRAPVFGEDAPVAMEITVLADDAPSPPPVEDDERASPTQEIRLEGFVEVTGVDYIVLRGERLALDERVLVTVLGAERGDLSSLLQGDLLEIDTRPGGRLGFVVTRIQVIDPSVQTFLRPGVIVGAFDGIEDEQLVLAGPFFQVPSDAEIRLQGGRDGGLSDLTGGDYVRLSASSPRFDRGETLPVAFKIRVATPPQGPPTAGEPGEGGDGEPAEAPPSDGNRRVVNSFPEDGDVAIPTKTAVEVRFNGDVNGLLFDPEFQFTLFPEPVSLAELQISADGRTISAEAELAEDVSYQLVVLSQTGLFTVRFTTGVKISTASLRGDIELPTEFPPQARFLPVESFAVLLDEAPAGELDMANFEGHVIAGVPLDGPRVEFENVEPGTYWLVMFVNFDLGRDEFVQIRAAFDADDDGTADAIPVGLDEQVEVAFSLALPAPLEVVSITPAQGSAGVEVETEIVVEFSQPALMGGDDIGIFPPAAEVGDLTRSEDGRIFTLPVTLGEDVIYRVVIAAAQDEEGGSLAGTASTVFTTAADFDASRSISGQLLLPALPSARVFKGPILVGAVRADLVETAGFGIGSFDESDIAASTVATGPNFQIDNVPEGEFLIVAFVQVEVPRGFRPPDPRQRSEGDFDLEGKRFNDQVLEVFDTIELFGFAEMDGGGPRILPADADDAFVYLRGSARTRDEILPVLGIEVIPTTVDGASSSVVDQSVEVDDQGRVVSINLEFSEDVEAEELIQVDVVVRFGKVLRVDRGIAAIEAALDGHSLQEFRLEEDGHVILFPVTLQAGHFQRFTVFKAESIDGGRLERPLEAGLNLLLGDAVAPNFATISGTVSLLTFDEEGPELTGDEADLIDEANAILFTEEDGELARVGAAEVSADGSYVVDGVLPGTYQIFAEVSTASGQQLHVIHDADIDDLADLLTIDIDGGDLTEIDMVASVTIATEQDTSTGTTVKTTPSGGNSEASLSLVFACDDEADCATVQSDVAVGDTVSLDLYVSGATDVDGVSARLRYDADILEFVDADDAPTGRSNFLRQDGGLALYLAPLLREPELEYGGAILGASAATAPDGGGFLGRLRFRVTDEFEGAQVFLEEATLASVTGRDDLLLAKSAKLAPQVFEEQTKGVVSFDFNTASQDQGEFHQGFITPGDLIEVDLYLNFDKISADFADLANYSVTVEFDSDQLSFLSFAPETADEANVLLAGGGIVPALPAIVGTNTVTVGAAILGPTADTAPDSSGLIGRLTLATTDLFTETDLLVTGYEVKDLDSDQLIVSMVAIARVSTGEITRVAAGGSDVIGGGAGGDAAGADMDGDGFVDFTDFFIVADAFGKEATGTSAVADLDGSGRIDFTDFFIFADRFGKAVGRVVSRQPLAVTTAPLTLSTMSTKDALVVDVRSDELALRGYAVQLSYDGSRFRLQRVSDVHSALRSKRHEPLLLSQSHEGRVTLAGSRTAGGSPIDGLLAQLHFLPLDPEAEGLFRLDAGIVRVGSRHLQQVSDLGSVTGRWVPQDFALSPNYPNPFNPSTTISFQLPVASKVTLVIYDILGQKIRTLVDDHQVAGVHRVVWDARNDQAQAVGAGVYFTRLHAGKFHQVQKLLLLK